ncbi:hypothetical protein G9C85_13640 [Halorubellus sp. JP-L1]|uniref:hypothetical protein n=1 Tax=Halorubellus sp. JP-L1 TaxID=2715753 RepID=UPI0014077639|nr:hypothetical protein [Halorubellus sp. JP-L1]NHN42665.1 hypothetical protein [Halorubellus sp. JP-L1]
MPADGADDDAERDLGASWGGSGGEDDGGPPPSAEEAAANARPEPEPRDPALVDEITVVLQEHKRAFTVAVLAYAFLVMPWLYRNGYEVVGLAGGIAALAGIVLVTVANAQAARDRFGRDDERRGF